MSCGCRRERPSEASDDGTVYRAFTPNRYCLECVYKHLSQFYAAYTEYGYSKDNQRYMAGELRMMVSHAFEKHPEISELARKIAIAIQEARNDEIRDDVDSLCKLVDDVYYKENPEIAERLKGLTDNDDGRIHNRGEEPDTAQH